jgi:chromosome segregation ATPase
MCCKKWVGGLAALALLVVTLGVVSGTDTGHKWLGLAWVQVQKVCGWADKQVVPEDELARMTNDANNLDKEIDDLADKVAHQKIEIKKTDKALADLQDKAKAEALAIKKLQKALDEAKGKTFVVLGGKESDIGVARKELTDTWVRFNSLDGRLQATEGLLKEQKTTLEALSQTREDMKKTKSECLAKIEQFKQELQAIRAAQARGEAGAVSDAWQTQVTRLKDSMDNFSATLDVIKEKTKDQVVVTKSVTGAAQEVKNDLAEEEIRKNQEKIDRLAGQN